MSKLKGKKLLVLAGATVHNKSGKGRKGVGNLYCYGRLS